MYIEIAYAIFWAFIMFGLGVYGFYMFVQDWMGWNEVETDNLNGTIVVRDHVTDDWFEDVPEGDYGLINEVKE